MESEQSKSSKWAKLLRVILIVLSVALIAVIIVVTLDKVLPGFFQVLENGDEAAIEAYLRSCGTVRGYGIAFLLQFIQILSIFFPGGPLQIAIGVVLGTWPGFLVCHIGYISANVLVFAIARKVGTRVVNLFVGGTKTGKLAFIANAKHPAFMVSLACLLPFLPNGLVPYIASGTKISFWSFLLAVWAGSIPCLLLLCAIGGKLLKGDYLFAALLCVLLLALIVTLYLLRNKIFALGEQLQESFQRHKERAQNKETHV